MGQKEEDCKMLQVKDGVLEVGDLVVFQGRSRFRETIRKITRSATNATGYFTVHTTRDCLGEIETYTYGMSLEHTRELKVNFYMTENPNCLCWQGVKCIARPHLPPLVSLLPVISVDQLVLYKAVPQ